MLNNLVKISVWKRDFCFIIPFVAVANAGVITDAPTVAEVLYKALQFLLSVFGFLAIIGLVISGVLYLTAAGDQRRIEKAKKAFYYSIVGIVIALGGWVTIKTVISLTG
ncbi:MAG: hypothetical protein NT136_00755 [Candidatus Moranbacteria bacterium]|nr:hypothetical protein [Candidatus Moranbacteria bacterium]